MADPVLEALITASHRSAANIARNAARHPVETLEFFGLRPDMTVLEILPSLGWYTEILAPYLAAKGRLIVAAPAGKGSENLAKRLVEVETLEGAELAGLLA